MFHKLLYRKKAPERMNWFNDEPKVSVNELSVVKYDDLEQITKAYLEKIVKENKPKQYTPFFK